MRTHFRRAAGFLTLIALAVATPARAQIGGSRVWGERGFLELTGFEFPQDTAIDGKNVVGDVLLRDDGFVKPLQWLQFAAGFDLRANTHDQVEDKWRVDIRDRGTLRPRFAIRRLNATIARGPLTLDIGKQFIRWGKTDVIAPTDRFAPRDFINVTDNDFLAVSGVRAVLQHGSNSIEGVWVPWVTPSRIPLLDQRWTSVPKRPAVPLLDGGGVIPTGNETGVRASHTGHGYEVAASYFDGFNHLPNIVPVPTFVKPGVLGSVSITKVYPTQRMYGADVAIPTRWFTVKSEGAYFTTKTVATDEYVIYTVQLERQVGEWQITGGYAGQKITQSGGAAVSTFAPDRGLTDTILARAAYTIDPNRNAAVEMAVRQNGDGFLLKGVFSQSRGQHWRATATASFIRGESTDFLGQYRLNSHATLALRYSF